MKVIMISGKSESGKDTFAKIFVNKLPNHKILVIHFADLVKYYATQYYNWDGQKNEQGRSLLQKLGTDMVRTVFPHYWGLAVSQFIAAAASDWDYVVIPDWRFPSELEDIRNFNSEIITIRINRSNIDGSTYQNNLTELQRQHPSECSLDDAQFDYILNNTGDYTSFETLIQTWMKENKICF